MDPDGDGKGEPVRTWRKPSAAGMQAVEGPPTSDEFSGPRLGLQWQWQANPRNTWLSLAGKPGVLRLFPQPMPAAGTTGVGSPGVGSDCSLCNLWKTR